MIRFFSEDISFHLRNGDELQNWIRAVILEENQAPGEINYIFCSDRYLHELNVRYLDHDTLTDIITFDQSEGETITGDIYISVERVTDNAEERNIAFDEELHRVMIHGILHLLGLTDKTPKEKRLMREKEDICLSLRNISG